MIKQLLLGAAAACACMASAGAAEGRDIRLGMTQQDFLKAYPHGLDSGVSIGGASTREGPMPPAVQFRDGRLEQFSAYFAAKDFERIRRALVAKNAGLQCSSTERQVAVCYDPEGSFVLTRSAEVTMLLLQSPRVAVEAERRLEGQATEF
jgi:hypothetical protein